MNHSLNLMTSRSRQHELIRHRIRQWSAVLVVTGLVGFGAEALLYHNARQLATRRDQLQADAAPLRALQQDIERLQRRIAALRQQEQIAIALAGRLTPLYPLGVVSKAGAVCGDRLHVTHMDLLRSETPADGDSGEGECLYTLALTGTGLDNATVARFGDFLSRDGGFRDVSVSTSECVVGETEACSFNIQCAL